MGEESFEILDEVETVVQSKGTTVVTEDLEGEEYFNVGWAGESGEVSVRSASVKYNNEINIWYGEEKLLPSPAVLQKAQRGGSRMIAGPFAIAASQDEARRIAERFFPRVRSSQGGKNFDPANLRYEAVRTNCAVAGVGLCSDVEQLGFKKSLVKWTTGRI